jgi:stringent starvation protein B
MVLKKIMPETSTKPYLLRAIYEWCTDNGYTPYLAAQVDANTRVPREFVKNGEIVLNISFTATSGLKMENDFIHFHARFGGIGREISVPVDNVVAIYARENGQGMAFEVASPAFATSEETATDTTSPASDDSARSPVSGLSAVPSSTSEPSKDEDGGDEPDPPKKGGRPTLTRIK